MASSLFQVYIKDLIAKHQNDRVLADIRAGRQNLSTDMGDYEQFDIQATFSVGELQISHPGSEGRNTGSAGRFIGRFRQTRCICGTSNT